MQYGVRDIRRQEVVGQIVKCFWCGKEGHKKWEYPEGKRKKREEEAPPREVWRKVKEHSGVRGLPPRGAAMCMREWTTPRECNKTAGELEHLRRRNTLFLFHFHLLYNSLKCVGHYDSKGVCGII